MLTAKCTLIKDSCLLTRNCLCTLRPRTLLRNFPTSPLCWSFMNDPDVRFSWSTSAMRTKLSWRKQIQCRKIFHHNSLVLKWTKYKKYTSCYHCVKWKLCKSKIIAQLHKVGPVVQERILI